MEHDELNSRMHLDNARIMLQTITARAAAFDASEILLDVVYELTSPCKFFIDAGAAQAACTAAAMGTMSTALALRTFDLFITAHKRNVSTILEWDMTENEE